MDLNIQTTTERIQSIRDGKNPHFVAEMETGYVILGDHQAFRGYTQLLCKEPAFELHYLDAPLKLKFLEEMSLVVEAVDTAFEPDKMNVELLGNRDPHMHWHIVPRNDDDPLEGKASIFRLRTEQLMEVIPSTTERNALRETLLAALKTVAPNSIKRTYKD